MPPRPSTSDRTRPSGTPIGTWPSGWSDTVAIPAELSWESYLTDPDHPAGPETLVVWPVADDDRVSGDES
jgi:hypothetical protein